VGTATASKTANENGVTTGSDLAKPANENALTTGFGVELSDSEHVSEPAAAPQGILERR
jgi:glycine betaine/choline ABC-type transport system substrate-binding protein